MANFFVQPSIEFLGDWKWPCIEQIVLANQGAVMNMFIKGMIVTPFVLFFLSCHMAFGEVDSSEGKSVGLLITSRSQIVSGWTPYLALNTGYTGTDSSAPVTGQPNSFKILGSYFFSMPFVFDAGLGFSVQRFQSEIGDKKRDGTILELAGRYRSDNQWEAGLVFNQLLNQGPAYLASQGDAQFLGVQAMVNFNMPEKVLGRLGGRIQTLANNTGTAVNMFLIDFQLGWNQAPTAVRSEMTRPQTEPESILQNEPSSTAQELYESEQEAAPESEQMVRRMEIEEFLAQNPIEFESSKYTLSRTAKSTLLKIAIFIRSNPHLFEKVQVLGYADPTGIKAKNKLLSGRRAMAVQSYLKENGVQIQIAAIGKGIRVTPEDLARDRRVDFIFVKRDQQVPLDLKALSTLK